MFSLKRKTQYTSDSRYHRLEKIGEGGMGAVWKALDSRLNTHVAVKTLLDNFDKNTLELFQKECNKLAALPHHPNIIRITDAGEIEENGRHVPYFVMPLLEGVTLAELLNRRVIEGPRLQSLLSKKTDLSRLLAEPDEKLPAELIVEIVCQVCKGLHHAHQNSIIHRDIKPSNIFLLTDFSVQLIDFGVARLTSGKSETVGLMKGTPSYMSPEQIQCKPLTNSSDIFSLGVVCYEALVGERPFVGQSHTELGEAIVWRSPPPPHEVAPVSLAVSQAVFKALAKKGEHRYLTAADFGEHLRRAITLGKTELFVLPRPRLTLALKHHEEGNHEASLKILDALQTEGMAHPEITELAGRVDLSLRRKRVEEGLAAARSLIESREYDQAIQTLERVRADDHANPTVLRMLNEIETLRTDADVEELLRQGRRQMDSYDFAGARRALDRVKQRRPREPRLPVFSKELDRVEEEYNQIQQERQRLYDAALSAFARRDISSARSHVSKLFALNSEHPTAPNPRGTEFNSIRSQVEAEQHAIDTALTHAKRLIAENRLDDAHEMCLAQLAKYPANEHFLHLQFEIEESRREALAAAIRETDALLQAEPDLLKQEKILEVRARQFPEESHFRQALERSRKLRALVEDIAGRARVFEGEKAFLEAQQEWRKLESIYPRYPGLQAEKDRLDLRRAEHERRQRKEAFLQQIHRHIDGRDFQAALDAIAQAIKEFPEDQELLACDALARAEFKKVQDAHALLQRGGELCASGDFEEGLSRLREAYTLDKSAPDVASGLMEALLLHASTVEAADPRAAEKSLREVIDIDPDYRGAKGLLDSFLDRRRDEVTSNAISRSLHLEREGDFVGALRVVETALRGDDGSQLTDARLTERRESLKRKFDEQSICEQNSTLHTDSVSAKADEPTKLYNSTEIQTYAEDENAADPGPPRQNGAEAWWKRPRSRDWLIGTASALLFVFFGGGLYSFFGRTSSVAERPAVSTVIQETSRESVRNDPPPPSTETPAVQGASPPPIETPATQDEGARAEVPTNAPSPEIIERKRRANALYQQAAKEYYDGADKEDVLKLLNEVLRLDPNHNLAPRLKGQLEVQ
jgi:serine/threonine-protein kinase